jgi:uncharacterized DUF497 family protein
MKARVTLVFGIEALISLTPRHDAIRIISARKANSREVKRYENRSHDD